MYVKYNKYVDGCPEERFGNLTSIKLAIQQNISNFLEILGNSW